MLRIFWWANRKPTKVAVAIRNITFALSRPVTYNSFGNCDQRSSPDEYSNHNGIGDRDRGGFGRSEYPGKTPPRMMIGINSANSALKNRKMISLNPMRGSLG
jgi:hypothetical protein